MKMMMTVAACLFIANVANAQTQTQQQLKARVAVKADQACQLQGDCFAADLACQAARTAAITAQSTCTNPTKRAAGDKLLNGAQAKYQAANAKRQDGDRDYGAGHVYWQEALNSWAAGQYTVACQLLTLAEWRFDAAIANYQAALVLYDDAELEFRLAAAAYQ